MEEAPLFLAYLSSDPKVHICIGTEPKTLCEKRDVRSATQVESAEKHQDDMDGKEFCTECMNIWLSVKHRFRIEPTIDCNRCGVQYSAYKAYVVNHLSSGSVPVCEPCYEDLLESDDSDVSKPKDEASRYYEKSADRKVGLDKEVFRIR